MAIECRPEKLLPGDSILDPGTGLWAIVYSVERVGEEMVRIRYQKGPQGRTGTTISIGELVTKR